VLANLAEISTTLAATSSTHLNDPVKTRGSSVFPRRRSCHYQIPKLKIATRDVNVFFINSDVN